jgi:branched-chain amino acid transport system ATP-binding protein
VPEGLEIIGIDAGYAGAAVLHGIDLSVRPGEVTCLLGPNGAGKSTLARVLAGLLKPTRGAVRLDGQDFTAVAAHRRVERGLSLVPEGRHLFGELSVRDNLLLGGYTRPASSRPAMLVEVCDLFPQLASRMDQLAGSLSGGQQQMVAVGRALMASPRYLVLDEPSLGLAPILVAAILQTARQLADRGVGVLLIEQNVTRSLEVSDTAVVLDHGRVFIEGPVDMVRTDDRVIASYLGGVL